MYRASIFDIPRKPEHLKSGNEGTANAHYRQITASKDVTKEALYQGVQQFRFENSGTTWFVPSMSYFRLRCRLEQCRRDGERPQPILTGEDIAPSMGLAANLFKSVELRLNGHTLERITERLPQIDALKTRMRNTGSWLDQIGKTTNFWDPNFVHRRECVATDGYISKRGCFYTHGVNPSMTQEQAMFHVQHLIRYDSQRQVLEFDANGQTPIDIMHGSMALRTGDRLRHGELELEIVNVIDETHALVKVNGCDMDGNVNVEEEKDDDDDDDDNDDGNAPHAIAIGCNGWHIQKIMHSGNNEARGHSDFEIVWRPPLGFFDIEHAIPPGGEWLIELNPANVMDAQKNVVESILSDLPVAFNINGENFQANSFNFAGSDFFFYAYTLESQRFDHGDWFLDLQNTRCQLQSIPNNSMSLTQKTFDVPGKTNALTVAFQDQGPFGDTRYSQSKFKIRPAPVNEDNGDGRFSAIEGQDLMLERFFIQYGNEQKPVPDFDGKYTKVLSNSTLPSYDFLVHRYIDTLMQANLYHTDGGAESYDDWLRRGPYYHFKWPKDAMQSSTRVTVNFKFARPFAGRQEHQVVLFSQWRSAYKITHRNGRVHLPTLQEL